MIVRYWMRWSAGHTPEMAIVELVYDNDCPNVAATRAHLLKAFTLLQLKPQWREWEINDPDAPAHVRNYGSPTILVNGRDISGDTEGMVTNNCRIYINENNSISGVPPLEKVVSALRAKNHEKYWFRSIKHTGVNMAVIPAIGIAMLPKLVCPFCWPLYTGLLGTVGINFVNYTPYLLPLLLVFLVITISTLAIQARGRRGYGPALAGLLSSIMILLGKFLYYSSLLTYAGIAGLILAVIWHAWPKHHTDVASCSACEINESNPVNHQHKEGINHDKT